MNPLREHLERILPIAWRTPVTIAEQAHIEAAQSALSSPEEGAWYPTSDDVLARTEGEMFPISNKHCKAIIRATADLVRERDGAPVEYLPTIPMVRDVLVEAHRNLDLATGPAGARAAMRAIDAALSIIDKSKAPAAPAMVRKEVAEWVREMAHESRQSDTDVGIFPKTAHAELLESLAALVSDDLQQSAEAKPDSGQVVAWRYDYSDGSGQWYPGDVPEGIQRSADQVGSKIERAYSHPPAAHGFVAIPDAAYVLLDELHADAAALFGRVAVDGSCGGAMTAAVREKIRLIGTLIGTRDNPLRVRQPIPAEVMRAAEWLAETFEGDEKNSRDAYIVLDWLRSAGGVA